MLKIWELFWSRRRDWILKKYERSVWGLVHAKHVLASLPSTFPRIKFIRVPHIQWLPAAHVRHHAMNTVMKHKRLLQMHQKKANPKNLCTHKTLYIYVYLPIFYWKKKVGSHEIFISNAHRTKTWKYYIIVLVRFSCVLSIYIHTNCTCIGICPHAYLRRVTDDHPSPHYNYLSFFQYIRHF